VHAAGSLPTGRAAPTQITGKRFTTVIAQNAILTTDFTDDTDQQFNPHFAFHTGGK
jgi:hypothetical protein